MKKSLEEILTECRGEMQKSIDVIDKLIAESKAQGIEWPELEEIPTYNDTEDDANR